MTEVNENERISLRLEPEDLRLLDDFIAESNEFSNRSQLARAAIRAYIDRRCAGTLDERSPNEVLVILPPLVLDTIEQLVGQGVYTSISEAIADSARHEFLNQEHIHELKRDANQVRNSAMRILPKD